MPKYQEVVEVGKLPELAGGKGEITTDFQRDQGVYVKVKQ